MGFRSVFITQDWNLKIPESFIEKWNCNAYKNDDRSFSLPISLKFENKAYVYDEMFKELQELCRKTTIDGL